MFHIIRQHFFFRFFCFDFQTPSEAEERIYSVFKSKEDAAVGANKTCAIELTLILTIYLVWFDWIDLKTVLWIGTPCINIIILRKKTTTYAYNIYYLSSRFSVLGVAKFFQPETETGCRLKTGRSSKKSNIANPNLASNTTHYIILNDEKKHLWYILYFYPPVISVSYKTIFLPHASLLCPFLMVNFAFTYIRFPP